MSTEGCIRVGHGTGIIERVYGRGQEGLKRLTEKVRWWSVPVLDFFVLPFPTDEITFQGRHVCVPSSPIKEKER